MIRTASYIHPAYACFISAECHLVQPGYFLVQVVVLAIVIILF
jgi:hypothetical protein